MKKVFSLFILLVQMSAIGCELREEVVSLSGPVSMLLEELGLMSDKNLVAISKFHPVKNKFNTKILAGGLFLSNKSLKEFKHSKIYYDKSREFKRLLKKSGNTKSSEVDTRDQDPFEAFNLSIIKLNSSLANCSNKIAKLEKKIDKIQQTLKLNSIMEKSIFYLGPIGRKYPDIVIANDGFVISLRKLKGFKSYPSELAYVTWSKKIMKTLSGFKHFGVSEGKNSNILIKKSKENAFNLSMRGALTPGLSQVYFLEKLQGLNIH